MSVHTFPGRNSIPERRLADLDRLCGQYLQRSPSIEDDGNTLTLTFTPDLTAGEETILARIMRVEGLMRITPAEWSIIEPDIDGLRTYMDISSPTNAQSVAAIKAIIRVLRALMRD